MAEIKIRKSTFYENSIHTAGTGSYPYLAPVTLYLVLVDNKRVDSFLKYRNAQKKVRRLKAEIKHQTKQA